MGDPECQTILPRLKTDFLEIVDATINKRLGSIDLEWFVEKVFVLFCVLKVIPKNFKIMLK